MQECVYTDECISVYRHGVENYEVLHLQIYTFVAM